LPDSNNNEKEQKQDDSEGEPKNIISFNNTEYNLMLDLVQAHLDKRQGYDTVAFIQIKRKLQYNAKGNPF